MISSASGTQIPSPTVVAPVVWQHCEEAAFLWLLRRHAIESPHYTLSELSELDLRIEAHIDGLRVAGISGWQSCQSALEVEEVGEVFAASVLALEAASGEHLDGVAGVAIRHAETFPGLSSAFGWISAQIASRWLPTLLNSQSPVYRQLAAAGYAVNRIHAEEELRRLLRDTDEATRARAIRATGELKRRDLLEALRDETESDDERCRFWSAWSAVLLGDKSALGPLKAFVNFDSTFDYTQRALQLALRAMPLHEAHNWLKGLAQDESHLREVITGCGVTGDPQYIPWLIKQMEAPELARVAGESFSMITGLDLAYDDLDTDWPEGFEAGPTEDPADENVEMDQDEDLPWPDPEKLSVWWASNSNRFQSGQRYLCGKPIDIAQCQHVLRDGFQRQRNAAALELALMQPDEPLFETRAPGFRQQQWLGLKPTAG